MLFRPRVVSGVECNSKEPKFEVDSHVDTNTTCLGSGALKIYDFDCPVNVQGYDSALGVKQFQTISGVVGYIHPFTVANTTLLFTRKFTCQILITICFVPCSVAQMA